MKDKLKTLRNKKKELEKNNKANKEHLRKLYNKVTQISQIAQRGLDLFSDLTGRYKNYDIIKQQYDELIAKGLKDEKNIAS